MVGAVSEFALPFQDQSRGYDNARHKWIVAVGYCSCSQCIGRHWYTQHLSIQPNNSQDLIHEVEFADTLKRALWFLDDMQVGGG